MTIWKASIDFSIHYSTAPPFCNNSFSTSLQLVWLEVAKSRMCLLIRAAHLASGFLRVMAIFTQPLWGSWKWKVKVKSLSRVRLFATPWTVPYQAPQSMEFSRQEYWSGLPFPSPEDLPNPGIEPRSPALQADALPSEPPGKPYNAQMFSLQFLMQSLQKAGDLGWSHPFLVGREWRRDCDAELESRYSNFRCSGSPPRLRHPRVATPQRGNCLTHHSSLKFTRLCVGRSWEDICKKIQQIYLCSLM